MPVLPRRPFRLSEHLAAKDDPALIAADEAHFAAIATAIDRQVVDLTTRLDAARRAPGRSGQAAFDRDQEIHRLSARLRMLRRFGIDLCLGRMVRADGVVTYLGRVGLTDAAGERLLLDWRSPAAEPFFGATHGDPRGLVSRRRYRWTAGQVTDYWDEVFTSDALAGHAALDDQSSFVASLGASRSPRMRDVLTTIAADQDAIVRAGSAGTLVVDGGPGTGKTVVALHRAAYLLYSDPHVGEHHGGVLFVGPHRPYLGYVADVLPGLGEEGVRTCTLADLLPEGDGARPEPDPEVARLKADARMVAAVDPAVALSEEPPTEGMLLETASGDVWLDPRDWAEAFAAPDPGTPHNEAADVVLAELLTILADKLADAAGEPAEEGFGSDENPGWDAVPGVHLGDDEFDAYGIAGPEPGTDLREELAADDTLRRAVARAWPLLEATDVVGDLWTVPAYLRRCAPWLTPDEVAALQRPDARAWTEADLPLLDAARRRLGDPDDARRRRRATAARAAERARIADVVDHLIATDDSDLGVMSMLRGQDLQAALVGDAGLPVVTPDALAGPFAHVVVDEAQELTDAQWQMLLARCPSRSLTVVGDRAQARHGFAESWTERLARVGLDRVEQASLTINYRTPEEVMAAAAPVIRAAVPDANVPTSVRPGGTPVRYATTAELTDVLDTWLAQHPEGTACVIGAGPPAAAVEDRDRVRSLTPATAKGLEFDLVVLVEPEGFGDGIEGAVDRYVSMTRATRELVVLGRP
ncbi:RNA polymerase recycling motor ATPase HelR [Isoptericola sp. b515]|uniref:RNA polymerase recycling motor ATPase HelR n=1 Tax=Isoptericola sp. b515 TaxID=3064652 RepID=UPI00271335C0|nr:RNA polymerase recycling motor ATPase HelR [Isoptericola sp. b515]MDO8147622.1 RNA polymerase recycling motor ATPase HelR [Isoptericola sp. b515]